MGEEGQGNRLVTTKENLSAHMQNIPLTGLGGTLLDFITVSRESGINCVWVDALCIIQMDDEDFAKESTLMHEVYSHAILTVSICSSESARKSFLIPREAEVLQSEHSVFAGSCLMLKPKSLQEIRKSSPLMKRA